MLKIHCDGGARGNPGPAASAYAVYNDLGEVIFSESKYLGLATNNQAEYAAVEMAVDWLNKNNITEPCEFYLDSMLVVNQLTGSFKIKNSELKEIYFRIKKIISEQKINLLNYIYVPREKNFLADSLVNQVLDKQHSE